MSIKSPLFAIGICAVLLAGCADPKADDLEAAGSHLRKLAGQCLTDTAGVPAEHSMHCIEAARNLWPGLGDPEHVETHPTDDLREYCREKDSTECRQFWSNVGTSLGLYWRAIAQSIANFGIPDGTKEFKRGEKVIFYKFSDRMKKRFERCLEIYPDPENSEPPKAQESEPFDPKTSVPQAPYYYLENEQCVSLGQNKSPFFPD